MIVKNEAAVIERCLNPVRKYIDHWIVVDTGSTDGTQDLIRAAMADLPGSLVERPWVDFAFNRSEALALARPHADYSLVIDADDELIVPDNFVMPKLCAPAYLFTIIDGPARYTRNQLFDNAKAWRYAGVIHEIPYCSEPFTPSLAPLAMRRGHDGARRRDRDTADNDIAVLERALRSEANPLLIARYNFYLAEYYQKAGNLRQSLALYLKCTTCDSLDGEEVYHSLVNAASVMEKLNEPKASILALFDQAIAFKPDRAEARHGASRYCRIQQDFTTGYRYAEAGLTLVMPAEGIDLQPWIYAYGLRGEYAMNAYGIGQYNVCLFHCTEILGRSDIPDGVRESIADLARRALAPMVDPVWGCQPSIYSAEFAPAWQV